MQLYVTITPVSAGTSRPAGEPRTVPCPADVEPDAVLSFLTGQFGEPVETAWTSTRRHARVTTGWVFPGRPATATDPAVELICVPLIRADDGTLRPLFEVQADQRRDVDQFAASGIFDRRAVVSAPHRVHQIPGTQQTASATRACPPPGRAVRRVLLRDTSDEGGTQFETAQIEEDGTLRVIGHDQGAGVTEFFGEGITSYEWVYTVAPDRVASLLVLAGGQPGQDPLDALAAYYDRTGGQTTELLEDPRVAADLSSWRS